MNHLLKKKISWILITGTLFTCFYWLCRLAIPGAAFEFATSITAITMSGLLSGRYVARLAYNTSPRTSNLVLVVLIGLVITGLMGMGWLISKMIGNTQFHHFFFTILLLFLVSGLVAAIISLVRNRIKTTLRLTQTALAQSKTELQLLQSQMSPHFLFNTLNNLYGLSLSEHYKVPELLLKLSDLLRYSVYEAKEIFVPLQDEVNYLKNYIEFEKIRLGDRLSLTLQLQEVNDKSVHIAPLLWIVFVENAFKHSKNNEDEKIFIHISLVIDTKSIFFSIKNSCALLVSKPEVSQGHSGFGLESVKKRLDLLYHEKHELEITQIERTFSVSLLLKYT